MNNKNINDLPPISEDEYVQRKPKKSIKEAIAKFTTNVLTIAIVAEIGLLGRLVYAGSANYIKNQDIIPEVSENLSADISILELDNRSNSIVKLKPNIYKKVFVYIDDDIPERTKKNIEESLEYFNNIFADINTKYQFEVCNKATYLANRAILNSVLKFEFKELEPSTYGEALLYPNRSALLESINKDLYYSNLYFTGNTIYLNSLHFDNLTDTTQKSTINHEILHTFGIDDTYEGFKEEASLMNVDYASFTSWLSPKDLSRLYILYDEKLIGENNTIDETEMTRVKEKISAYEKEYYQEVVRVIQERIQAKMNFQLQNISDEELVGFKSSLEVSKTDISINEDGTFSYQTANGTSGTRKFIKGENYVILPDIRINENYEDYFIILKQSGQLKAYNVWVFAGVTNDLTSIENKVLGLIP